MKAIKFVVFVILIVTNGSGQVSASLPGTSINNSFFQGTSVFPGELIRSSLVKKGHSGYTQNSPHPLLDSYMVDLVKVGNHENIHSTLSEIKSASEGNSDKKDQEFVKLVKPRVVQCHCAGTFTNGPLKKAIKCNIEEDKKQFTILGWTLIPSFLGAALLLLAIKLLYEITNIKNKEKKPNVTIAKKYVFVLEKPEDLKELQTV